MPGKTEALARRIARDLQIYTRGRSRQLVPVETVTRRLFLKDEASTVAALELARAKGWLTVEAGQSVCLTDAGRSQARKA